MYTIIFRKKECVGKALLFAFLIIPWITCHAQTAGVQFLGNLTWNQVKQLAASENKYIFLDCFATWCGPCKEMDHKVYVDSSVAAFTNAMFVSARVQMDTTAADDPEVRSWYNEAQNISTTLRIDALPTYLFYSPQGIIVHRSKGFQNSGQFISLLKDALDSNEQYYTLKEKYREGRLSISKYTKLADLAKDEMGDKMFGDSVARNYIVNYLQRQNNENIFEKNNLNFLDYFAGMIAPTDRIFTILTANKNLVDSIMGAKGAAYEILSQIIAKVEINPYLYKDGKRSRDDPNWDLIQQTIGRKYDTATARYMITNIKYRWYYQGRDWPKAVKFYIQRNEAYGIDTAGDSKYLLTNNLIFTIIFQHCNDTNSLKKAIAWMKVIVDSDPADAEDIDTYANLLYKVGKTEDALKFEAIASKLSPGQPEIAENLKKMQAGKPTWIE